MSMHSNYEMKHNYLDYNLAGAGLFWFVVLIVILFMFFVLFKPDFVQRKKDCEPTGEVDCMKAFLASIVVAIVICFIIWLIAYAFWC